MVSLGSVFATYVHDLNPVLLRITDQIQLRWYGLAYLAGFVAGYILLRFLARRKLWVLREELVGDFIAAMALFGVFLGGRLGYILMYQIPDAGWDHFLNDPLMVLRVWEGGMASHGGILGIVIFTWFYARKHKVSWTGLGDAVCVVAPIGLFCGRIANFINGELYGRVAEGLPWGVRFPLSLMEAPEEVQHAARYACGKLDPGFGDLAIHQLVVLSRSEPELLQVLANFIPARHPSQIYEALLEGLLLFAILWAVRIKLPKAPDGLLTALFFGLYALFRILGEQFREPDSAMVGVFTKGQFFSLFMLLFALGFGWHAWRGWRSSRPGPKAKNAQLP